MRFLLDQNRSPRLAVLLRAGGHDAVHAFELGLEQAEDDEVLAAARNADRVLVSGDTDFGALLPNSSSRICTIVRGCRVREPGTRPGMLERPRSRRPCPDASGTACSPATSTIYCPYCAISDSTRSALRWFPSGSSPARRPSIRAGVRCQSPERRFRSVRSRHGARLHACVPRSRHLGAPCPSADRCRLGVRSRRRCARSSCGAVNIRRPSFCSRDLGGSRVSEAARIPLADLARQPASRRRTSATSAARRSASARPSSLATAAR